VFLLLLSSTLYYSSTYLMSHNLFNAAYEQYSLVCVACNRLLQQLLFILVNASWPKAPMTSLALALAATDCHAPRSMQCPPIVVNQKITQYKAKTTNIKNKTEGEKTTVKYYRRREWQGQ